MKSNEFETLEGAVDFSNRVARIIEALIRGYQGGCISERELELDLIGMEAYHAIGITGHILAGLLGKGSKEVKAFSGANRRIFAAQSLLAEGMLKGMGESWYEQSVELFSDGEEEQ